MGCWRNTIERILARHVDKTEGCWIWKGYRKAGYGHVQFKGRLNQAHRVIYEALRGPISEGLCLDHLCRNPSCVNPEHLEPVTQAENIRRGLKGELKTHCAKGHPFTADNIYYLAANNTRKCRICKREAYRRWAGKNRDRVRTYLRAWKRARRIAV